MDRQRSRFPQGRGPARSTTPSSALSSIWGLSAPDVELKAGVPVTVTIETWRVTSVCFYPNSVNRLTARMMPSPDIFATPIYEERFAVQYTVMQ